MEKRKGRKGIREKEREEDRREKWKDAPGTKGPKIRQKSRGIPTPEADICQRGSGDLG